MWDFSFRKQKHLKMLKIPRTFWFARHRNLSLISKIFLNLFSSKNTLKLNWQRFFYAVCTSLSYFFLFFYFSFFVCEFEVQKYHKSKFQTTTTTKCYGEQNSKPYLPTDMFLSLILYKFLLKIFFAFFISIFLNFFLRKNVFSFHRRIKFAAMSSPLTSRHAKLIKVQLGKFLSCNCGLMTFHWLTYSSTAE